MQSYLSTLINQNNFPIKCKNKTAITSKQGPSGWLRCNYLLKHEKVPIKNNPYIYKIGFNKAYSMISLFSMVNTLFDIFTR